MPSFDKAALIARARRVLGEETTIDAIVEFLELHFGVTFSRSEIVGEISAKIGRPTATNEVNELKKARENDTSSLARVYSLATQVGGLDRLSELIRFLGELRATAP